MDIAENKNFLTHTERTVGIIISNMKVLVIGGSRFVGPYIIDLLLKHKHKVTVFNRGLLRNTYTKKITFIQGDRTQGFDIKETFDVVIDTCAYIGEHSRLAVKQLKFGYFVNFSSVAVYKDPTLFPMKEDAPLGGFKIMGPYGKGKVESEKVLQKSHIHYANIRPTYILGPNNCLDRENFIYTRLRANKPISLPGNGQALLQFVFADEVAWSIVKLAENQIEGSFNCVGDECITLTSLIVQMARIAKVKPIIEYNPSADGINQDRSDFPFANQNFVFSNEKIKNLGITFAPLLEGLKRDYQAYYRKTTL